MSEVHVMVDLETLGTGPDAVILSIGAIKFDPAGVGLAPLNKKPRFEVHVDVASAMSYGLKVDASTLMWWLDPHQDAARKELLRHERIGLSPALIAFSRWLDTDPVDVRVWGNGAAFDNVILAYAHKATVCELPWGYYGNRCYRTMKSLFPQVKMERVGTHHSAVDDATSQALHLQAIFREMRGDVAVTVAQP